MDLPSLHLESPVQRPWVQKLALDSLPSPSPSQHNLQLQNLATKHWRKIRNNIFANSFSELQKEDEEYNIYTSASEASSPQSPRKPWIGSPEVSASLGPVLRPAPAPAVQLLQAQLQEATEEIERLYTEKEDVEQVLKQVRRNSIRLEQLPDPDSPEEVSVEPLPEEVPEMSMSMSMMSMSLSPSVFDRKALHRHLTLAESPWEEQENYVELLAEERRLRNEENDAWEILRSNLEEKQAELQLEVSAAFGEAEAAMERPELRPSKAATGHSFAELLTLTASTKSGVVGSSMDLSICSWSEYTLSFNMF